jgi:hypothetical protein
MRRIVVGGTILCCLTSCVGRQYGLLESALGAKTYQDSLTKGEALACLKGAKSESDRADGDHAIDTLLIVFGGSAAAAGAGLSTASGFISDTHDNGKPSDTRTRLAAAGAITVGLSTAILGLRTVLNLGQLANSRVTASAVQAGLATQIAVADADAGAREALFSQCEDQNVQPGAGYTPVTVGSFTGGGDGDAGIPGGDAAADH